MRKPDFTLEQLNLLSDVLTAVNLRSVAEAKLMMQRQSAVGIMDAIEVAKRRAAMRVVGGQ